MQKFFHALEDENTPRSSEEYMGAFTESLNLILHHNPVEQMGLTVMLAAKTALRLKAGNPKLREHDIASKLQGIARNVRLAAILRDLTPEEKNILNLNQATRAARAARAAKPAPGRNHGRNHGRKRA